MLPHSTAESAVAELWKRVTSTYLFPFKEDICRFDFEVAPEDEYMCDFLTSAVIKSKGSSEAVGDKSEKQQ